MPTPREAYQNTVQRQAPSGARLQAADFGSAGEMVGRAAQGLGQAIGDVADTVDKIQYRDATTAAQEADNIRTAKRLERLYGENGFFTQEGRNALTDREALDADLKAIDQETETLLQGKPIAQRLFQNMTVRRNSEDMPRIAIHTGRERVKFEEAVDEATLDTAIDNAASSKDPAVIANSIQTAKDLAVKQAQRKGMDDPALLENITQSTVGKVVEGVAKQLELQSPDEAMAFVTLHAGEMDPDDAAKLMGALAPGAAKERAGSDIANFLVVAGDAAPADATPAAGAAPSTAAGGSAPTPMPDEAALDAAQWQQESQGRHRGANGRLTESPAGALGVSQVMPGTGVDPGYGVKPLQNDSREEYIRFGKDYRKAMLKEYNGNIVLALTAYNWGPGNVNAHIAKVGDPRKGEISDAAFLNSIGNKEAREYASLILGNTGVSVSGNAGPSRGRPVQVGQEIDIDATINNIRNSDRTFADKEALIAEATRLHSYGKQAKADEENTIKDAVWEHINSLPVGQFTDYSKIPLDVRKQLDQHPDLAMSFKLQAQANADRIEAENDKTKDEAFKTKLAVLEQDLMALSWSNPQAFQKIDFYGSPKWAKMGTAKVTEWMKRQQDSIDAGAGKGPDIGAIRTEINRFTSKEVQKDAGKMGLILQTVTALEEKTLNDPDRRGKPLTQTERQAIVMQATTEATFTVNGETRTGTRAEAAAAGARTSQVNIYDHARAELQRRWGRVPLPAEVEAAVQQYRRSQGGM